MVAKEGGSGARTRSQVKQEGQKNSRKGNLPLID